MAGGINNLVYRIESARRTVVVKGYPELHPGHRDRLQAEVDFLRYARLVGPSYVPELLHVDVVRRCVVLEHIEGSAYSTGVQPHQSDINAACVFFEHLNRDLSLAKQHLHLAAAEGYLRITEHLNNVEGRIAKMNVDHLEPEQKAIASALLPELRSQVVIARNKTETAIRSGFTEDAIAREHLVVSPSDFGFHNAIRTPSGVRFIDFEFSGWDDPTKAVADYVLQPRIPIKLKLNPLLDRLPLKQRKIAAGRIKILGPVLRLKWVCIILSVLQPDRIKNFLTANTNTDANALIEKRLTSAIKYLEQEVPFWPTLT